MKEQFPPKKKTAYRLTYIDGKQETIYSGQTLKHRICDEKINDLSKIEWQKFIRSYNPSKYPYFFDGITDKWIDMTDEVKKKGIIRCGQ